MWDGLGGNFFQRNEAAQHAAAAHSTVKKISDNSDSMAQLLTLLSFGMLIDSVLSHFPTTFREPWFRARSPQPRKQLPPPSP